MSKLGRDVRGGCAILVGLLVALVVPACDGGDSSSTGQTGGGPGGANASTAADFVSSYAQIFCSAYQPCCVKAGLKGDASTCRTFITAFLGSSVSSTGYDPAAGQACLKVIQDTIAKNDICVDGPDDPAIDAACDKVISGKGGGGSKKPGETCSEDSDCAAAPQGDVQCRSYFTSGAETRICQVELDGKQGDAPCLGTRDGNTTYYSGSSGSEPPPAQGYICNKKDGLQCDSMSKACAKIAAVGEKCSSSDGCVATAYCDKGECAAKKAVGSDCTSSFNGECDDTSYCDTMTTKKCVARIADGAACKTSDECLSDRCVNSLCEKKGADDLGTALLCGSN